MRLLALTGVVLSALVGAGTAHADHILPIPPSTASPVVNNVDPGAGGAYRTTGATQAAIAVRGYEPLAAPWSPAGTNSIPATINKMQRKGRILPSLLKLGSIGITGVVGVEIADDLGGFIYQQLTGETYGGALSGDETWRAFCPGGTADDCFNGSSYTFPPGATVVGATIPLEHFWIIHSGGSAGYHHCDPYSQCWGSGDWQDFSQLALSSAGTQLANSSTICQSDGTGVCYVKYRSEDAMETLRETTNITENEYNDLSDKRTINYPAPGGLGSDTDRENSASALIESDGTQTPGQRATEEAICEDLFPGDCVTDEEFALPAPQPNETYSAYMTRLAALGHVGTITTVEEGTALSAYGPEAVTRVKIHVVPNRVLDPNAWPSTAPRVLYSTDLTLRYNPDTATPVPTEGTTAGGTTTVTGTPTTIPGTPSVDFTPITGLDPGCKFPYGFICYAVDFTEQFDVAADAPVFSFTLGWTGMVNGQEEGGEAPYTVDLEVMDDYMALWRGILTVVLWVGAIFLVATRMLGVKFGGDPGEAIDDVL